MTLTLSVGSATFTDTNGGLVINGVEVFRLRTPAPGDHLCVDFEVRSADNHVLAIVQGSTCVQAAPGVAVRQGPAFCEIVNPHGEMVARAEKLSANVVRVYGTFHVDGSYIRADGDVLDANGSLIEGHALECSGGPAVSVGRSPDEESRTFEDETVIMDGKFYRACTFRNCLLVYTGRELPLLVCCYFEENCRLELREHAQRTAQFLAGLHQHIGCGGKGIVSRTLDGIRHMIPCGR